MNRNTSLLGQRATYKEKAYRPLSYSSLIDEAGARARMSLFTFYTLLFTLVSLLFSCSNLDNANPDSLTGHVWADQTNTSSSSEVASSSSGATSSAVVSSSAMQSSSSSAAQSSSSFTYVLISSSSVSASSSSEATSSAVVSSSATQSSSSSAAPSSSSVSSSSTTPTISDSTLIDTRDGQTYKTVVIGTQTWMAQNLNYTTSGNSWCYSNLATNCTTYGRLYDYATALTACPTGWHLPDTTAWNTLEAYVVGGIATAGTKLKANNSTLWNTNTGTDAYGFSALPGGFYNGTTFGDVGSNGYWWTATPYGATGVYSRYMHDGYAYVNHYTDFQTYGLSARCLKDSP